MELLGLVAMATTLRRMTSAFLIHDEGDAAVISMGRHTLYRDVYAFVDRLKDMVTLHGDRVKEVLPTCLFNLLTCRVQPRRKIRP